MTKFNVLIFDEQGFFYGSTQKLFRQMAKILANDFQVFFAYGKENNEEENRDLKQAGITTVFFDFDYKKPREPFTIVGMRPKLSALIEKNNIHCIYTTAYAHYQFPINSIPASIPLVLISPFGHFCTNGNVAKTYVSGKGNFQRLLSRGVKNAEVFFNPLEDFAPEYLNKQPVGEQIVFGRIGRGEDSIFDPIAAQAFKKLEDAYPGKVKYIVVNPPPAWVKLAWELKIKNMEFQPAIIDKENLAKFYREIDVLAHARKDGETVGMAIGEAMMAGNPILTHKSHFHNDHFDILDSSYALWSEAGDIEKYFQNMKWMVENKNQIRQMGQLARKRALEIFSLEKQAPKIIADFKAACKHYYHDSFFGRLKGRMLLNWENFKAMPFFVGKALTYKFPRAYKILRKFYYE